MTASRIALELRLCVPIVVEHTCICGAVVDVYGSHSLSCRCSGDRVPRHTAVNETVCHALVSGVYLLFWSLWVDGKRPDGMSLIPWRQCLATLPVPKCSPLPSNVSTFSRDSSRLANSAESAKFKKYSSLTTTFHFSLCRDPGCLRIQCTLIGEENRLTSLGDNKISMVLIGPLV